MYACVYAIVYIHTQTVGCQCGWGREFNMRRRETAIGGEGSLDGRDRE